MMQQRTLEIFTIFYTVFYMNLRESDITTLSENSPILGQFSVHPYGMLLPERHETAGSSYRYGFNGMEKDDEIKGNNNSYDFGARLYDPRVGRWLSMDPLAMEYVPLTPYNFALNSPVFFIDANGNVIIDANGNVVKINTDEAGNVTGFDSDGVDESTVRALNYYLLSDVGKTQLKKMHTAETKIDFKWEKGIAVTETPEGKLNVVLAQTTHSGKAKDDKEQPETSSIIIYEGSMDLYNETSVSSDISDETDVLFIQTDGTKDLKKSGKWLKKQEDLELQPNAPGKAQTEQLKNKEYAIESTLVHESGHTLKDNYQLKLNGGDFETPCYQLEKDLYDERYPEPAEPEVPEGTKQTTE